MTFAPEECYASTVLVNLLGTENITPWNCRFIRWKYENGNRPANLGNEHFYLLTEREYLFARKMEWACSTELTNRIDNMTVYITVINEINNGNECIHIEIPQP